jgi:hypothetical protein
MRNRIERNPSYSVRQYNEKWFWSFKDQGQGMHGPFNTEREAYEDADEYIRIQWEWEHGV